MKTIETTRPPVTRRLAELAAGDFAAGRTPAARSAARRHLLDTLGAIVAGMQAEPTRITIETLAALGLGMSDSIVVPGAEDHRWDALSAAYVMGTAAHGLELDDGYTGGSVHPGAPVVPALLAALQLRPECGPRLLIAMAVGYEFVARLASGIHPASRRRGFHNTALVGPLAAAAAVGCLFGLDAATVESAIGLAASSAGGLFAFLNGGGDVKRLHPGHAAREGLLAALLAERGLRGPVGVIEGPDGFLQAFGNPAHSSLLAPEPVDRPAAITRCYMKPWACCRHLHPAIDAVLGMRDEGVAAADVDRIDIATYAIAASHAGVGWADTLSAQMSYPFAVSVALVRGHADLADFADGRRDEAAVTALCDRIAVTVDPAFDDRYPRTREAHVRTTMRDGRVFERTVDDGLGSAMQPLDEAMLAAKFDGLVEPVVGAGRARAIRDALASLEARDDAEPLLRELVRRD